MAPQSSPLDARCDLVAGRQHQDGHAAAARAERAAHGETVDARQHRIEDERVVVGRADLEQRHLAVRGNVNRVGLLAEALGEDQRRLWFVFHKQYPHVLVNDIEMACHRGFMNAYAC